MQDADTVTWLHISDTHFSGNEFGFSDRIKNDFYKDLRALHEKYNLHPNMIFHTGDLIGHTKNSQHKSLEERFNIAKDFIQKIIDIYSSEGIEIKNIFIVPGNRDINTLHATQKLYEYFKKNNQTDRSDLIDKMCREDKPTLDAYLKRLEDYKQFLKSSGYTHLVTDQERLFYSHMRDFNGFKIGIAGLNSAWSSSGDSKNDKQNLWLGTHQIIDSYTKLSAEKVNIFINLIHHPSEWFGEDTKDIQRLFTFSLHGHSHQIAVNLINNHIQIAAGAFDHEKKLEKVYNFVRISPSAKNSSEKIVEVFVRRYDDYNHGWVKSPAAETAPDGVHTFILNWTNPEKTYLKISRYSDGCYKSILKTPKPLYVAYKSKEKRFIIPTQDQAVNKYLVNNNNVVQEVKIIQYSSASIIDKIKKLLNDEKYKHIYLLLVNPLHLKDNEDKAEQLYRICHSLIDMMRDHEERHFNLEKLTIQMYNLPATIRGFNFDNRHVIIG